MLKEEKGFKYIEKGEGTPLIILHGLMGGLSNFDKVINHFADNFRVLMPELPVYTFPLLKTSVKGFAKYLDDFLKFKKIDKAILLGNSLGGHVALYYTNKHPEKVEAIVLTGSSGLYEKGMGDSYPKRNNYDYIKKKAQEVFHDPKVATKELVDEIFRVVNDRMKVIRTLALAKSAIRHNMAKDLPNMNLPVCLIWGKNDNVTPPEVAEEFKRLLPNADLYWIDKCGHAPMMEHPEKFNQILEEWFIKKGFMPKKEKHV
jgi:pimeloyl-ACP methyl ester carboxylesterase